MGVCNLDNVKLQVYELVLDCMMCIFASLELRLEKVSFFENPAEFLLKISLQLLMFVQILFFFGDKGLLHGNRVH